MCSPLRTIASPMGRDHKRPSPDRNFPTVPKTLDFNATEDDEDSNSKELFSPTLKFNEEDTKTESSDTTSTSSDNNNKQEQSCEGDEDETQHEEEKEECDEFNPFFFIKSLPPYEEVIKNRVVPILLPKRTYYFEHQKKNHINTNARTQVREDHIPSR